MTLIFDNGKQSRAVGCEVDWADGDVERLVEVGKEIALLGGVVLELCRI